MAKLTSHRACPREGNRLVDVSAHPDAEAHHVVISKAQHVVIPFQTRVGRTKVPFRPHRGGTEYEFVTGKEHSSEFSGCSAFCGTMGSNVCGVYFREGWAAARTPSMHAALPS